MNNQNSIINSSSRFPYSLPGFYFEEPKELRRFVVHAQAFGIPRSTRTPTVWPDPEAQRLYFEWFKANHPEFTDRHRIVQGLWGEYEQSIAECVSLHITPPEQGHRYRFTSGFNRTDYNSVVG